MKNVLVAIPNFESANGVAKVIMNYSKSLVENGYKIDYLVISDKNIDKSYKKKIEDFDSKILVLPKHNKWNRYWIVKKFCKNLFKDKTYDIIHVNLVDIYAVAIFQVAKKYIDNRIYHIHNPNSGKNFIKIKMKEFFNFLCKKNANIFYSCSKSAADSMLKNKKYEIIKNPINVQKFNFDNNRRNQKRLEYKIRNDEILIGTVARMEEQKNPFFILDIIYELIKLNSKIKFIYVGEGSLKNKLEDYVLKLKIEKNIIFSGSKENVNDYYFAMDIFLLPSKFEGLGIVYLEAQASGLPVVASNYVPKDIQITDLVTFLCLEQDPKEWAEKIIKLYNENLDRNSYNLKVISAGYDIDNLQEGSLLYNYNKIGGI